MECCYFCFVLILTLLVVMNWGSQSCYGVGTFGFDIHHRYSDSVKGILDLRGLPEKGSFEYYAAMAHRDRLFRGRKLGGETAPLIFSSGNETYRLNGLGYLHYANISVGSPGLWFLVALDTGSDLFWLPCNCTKCVRGLIRKTGEKIDFSIYSPNTSSTSMKVPCNSTSCGKPFRCSKTYNTCAYQYEYISDDTSSTGLLVEDVLHLSTEDSSLKSVDARITFGCGMIQTGTFLDGAAPNGLFGLGMDSVSVPTILANEGLAANSFSMCFGRDGVGRIIFGDKGSSERAETPFNIKQSHPTYNVSMTQIIVGNKSTDVGFNAIFDTGTSFTYLNDPAYTVISESFNSQAQETRHPSDSGVPFEYCYDLSENQNVSHAPLINLTMKGGKQFSVTRPVVTVSSLNGGAVYCLAIVKSEDINLIGQNFMTGYRIVFDREKMVLGWEPSNCYDSKNSNALPIHPRNSSGVPPTSTVGPEATSGPHKGSAGGPSSPARSNGSPMLIPSSTCLLVFLNLPLIYYYVSAIL